MAPFVTTVAKTKSTKRIVQSAATFPESVSVAQINSKMKDQKVNQLSTSDSDKELPKNLAVPKPFKPTAAMRLWVAASIELSSDVISQIADKCEVDRNNWYQWLKKDGFLEWYGQERQRQAVLMQQKLDSIGLQMAAKDYRYWKDMQKIVGRDLSEGQQPQSPIQLGIQNIIGEKKREYDI